MAHSLVKLHIHVIFHINLTDTVKIPIKLQPSLHSYLATTCKNHDSPAIVVGGTDDHIHILCRLSKNIAPSKLLEELKTNSSKWIKTQAREFGSQLSKFSWQKGYGVFSVSESKVSDVERYISNQIEHHKTRSFKDEYELLLKKHNVEYDEKYLWR